MHLLVLHVRYSVRASYYEDWLDAFQRHPGLRVRDLNLFARGERADVRRLAREADGVVILHSGTADTLDYVRKVAGALKERRGPLLVFMGNEFNMPWLPFAERRAFLSDVGADLVATQLVEATGRWLYEGTGARVVSVPHALNPVAFTPERPAGERTVDIGSRSFPYPVYLGNRIRNDFLRRVAEEAPRLGYVVDIDHHSRLDRTAWAAFLNACRYTIATEAGASHLERDDTLAFEVQAYMQQRRKGVALRPNSMTRGLARQLPWSVRERLHRGLRRIGIAHEAIEDDHALHEEVIARFFGDRPPSVEHGGCISSRHFDAIGCGTAQLLVEGRYNDILTADEHYLPVAPDFSNLGTQLARLADPALREELVERARAHVLAAHTLAHRVDAVVGHLGARR